MKMEQIVCSETSAYKIQTPGNYPEVGIQHSEHGESLKSRSATLPRFLFKTFWSNILYEGWNFNSGNYLFTADTK